MGDTYIISGLTTKRAEVSGIIADLEKRIAQHRADLVHIDAVLRLYAPELEPESIAPKAVRKRNDWFKPGELSRMVLDILRIAPAPMTGKEIAAEVMQRRGINAGDARTAHLVGKLVHNAVASALTHSEGAGSWLSLAKMVSAGLVQTKGLAALLCARM